MAKIEVKMEDHKEEILEAMKEQLAGALEAVGLDAASTAADKAPVDTGNLKNSTHLIRSWELPKESWVSTFYSSECRRIPPSMRKLLRMS